MTEHKLTCRDCREPITGEIHFSSGGPRCLQCEIHDLKQINENLLEALEEILLGSGPFSRDPLQHASNCIESMKDIATKAIAAAEGGEPNE